VTLSSYGNNYQAQEALSNFELYSVKSLFDTFAINVTDKDESLEHMVLSILTYSPDVCSFHKALDFVMPIEMLFFLFLNSILYLVSC
jgi:hypothetical protein